eukprot:2430824-Rhodomonas_salina.2
MRPAYGIPSRFPSLILSLDNLPSQRPRSSLPEIFHPQISHSHWTEVNSLFPTSSAPGVSGRANCWSAGEAGSWWLLHNSPSPCTDETRQGAHNPDSFHSSAQVVEHLLYSERLLLLCGSAVAGSEVVA